MTDCSFGYVELFYSEKHKEKMIRCVFGDQDNPETHEFFLPDELEKQLEDGKEFQDRVKSMMSVLEIPYDEARKFVSTIDDSTVKVYQDLESQIKQLQEKIEKIMKLVDDLHIQDCSCFECNARNKVFDFKEECEFIMTGKRPYVDGYGNY